MSARLTIALEHVAQALDVPSEQIMDGKRARQSDVQIARCMVAWLLHSTTDMTLSGIGRLFGLKLPSNHATVLYRIRSCEKLRDADPAFRELTDNLKERLEQAYPSFLSRAQRTVGPRTVS